MISVSELIRAVPKTQNMISGCVVHRRAGLCELIVVLLFAAVFFEVLTALPLHSGQLQPRVSAGFGASPHLVFPFPYLVLSGRRSLSHSSLASFLPFSEHDEASEAGRVDSRLCFPLLCLDHGLLRSGLAFTSTGIGFDDLTIIRHNSTEDFEDIVEGKRDSDLEHSENFALNDIIASVIEETASPSSPPPPSSKLSSPLTISVLKYVRLLKARGIVVGLPLFKDGAESRQSKIVRRYCEQELKWSLAREFGGEFAQGGGFDPRVRVFLFDERYSSSEAAALMSWSGSGRVTRDLDAVSACVVLSHYCKVQGKGGEEVGFRLGEEGGLKEALKAYELGEGKRRLESERLRNVSTLQESRKEMISRLEGAEPTEADDNKKKKRKKKKKKGSRAKWTKLQP